MKVATNTAPQPTFKPFNITITFESLEEAQQFHAMHNACVVTDYTRSVSHARIRNVIEENCNSELKSYVAAQELIAAIRAHKFQ